MATFLVVLAGVTLLVFLKTVIEIRIGERRIARLDAVPPLDSSDAPGVSVIIPACNEEEMIEAAMQSVLAQDYPRLEVIAVDDRSSDLTGTILDRMAASHPALKVLHIRDLPDNWLGK